MSEDVIAKNFSSLVKKTLVYRPKKLNKPQVRKTQGDPHLFTS